MTSAWHDLAVDYELARQRSDSLDRILEWPAQRAAIGDVTGQRILDVGCGSGAKALALADEGASEVVGIDISGIFAEHDRGNVELVQGDLSTLSTVPAVQGRQFETILFLQSIGYSRDQKQTLMDAKSLLAADGQILVQRSHPIRYAVERALANGTSLGEEYYSTQRFMYRSGWNNAISLSHSNETFSTILNSFASAGLTVDAAIEPELSAEARERYPHKQEWLNQHLGVIIFILSAR